MIANITTFDNILYWSKSTYLTSIYVSCKAATSSGHSNYYNSKGGSQVWTFVHEMTVLVQFRVSGGYFKFMDILKLHQAHS